MRRIALIATICLLFAAVVIFSPASDKLAAQAGRPAGTTFTGKAFRFNKVKDGIYHAIGTGNLAVVGNSTIIVNDNDTIVVDDHVSPAAAWVLLEEIKEFTTKPVTTVINTHFHFDHAHGNQIFDPSVQIIGHEFTRRAILDDPVSKPLYQGFYGTKVIEGQIETLRKRIADEKDPAARARLEVTLNSAEQNYASQKELKPTPPNVTLTTQMTLHRGAREIQIRYLGRGHTAGDVVVYLPRERVVITGDFLTSGTSNLSDSYPLDWATSLDALKKLDFDTVIPGHGDAYTDKGRIDTYQAYLRDAWAEVSRLKKEGVSVQEAAKRADLSKYKPSYPNPAIPVIGVQRMYDLIDNPSR
jgi:cyclase